MRNASRGADEALTGEPAGQPLSRESKISQGADAVSVVEGNMNRRVSARVCSTLAWSKNLHVGTLFAREPGVPLGFDLAVRIGRREVRSRDLPVPVQRVYPMPGS